MSDYSFIKEFQNIKISNYCKENNINLGNLLSGCTTDENYKKVKNYIIRELMKIMIEEKQDDLILMSLYSDMLEKLEKENKALREMI